MASGAGNPAKEIAEKFIAAENEAWDNGNVDALDEVEDPNIVLHVVGQPDIMGRDAHKQFIAFAREAYSNPEHEFFDVIGTGNIAAFRYTERFIFDKEMEGLPPPTGKDAFHEGAMFLHIKNGKIVELYMLFDTLTLNRALGLVPESPELPRVEGA